MMGFFTISQPTVFIWFLTVMPPFFLIRMSWEHGVTRALSEFTETFEAGGGVMLTMDEFMAALNPRFMVAFAAEQLGADDAGVRTARRLLRKGRFWDSLIAVRQALADAR